MATDPVCGMVVDERTASLRLVRDNRTYYFCSAECRETFAAPQAARVRNLRRLAVAWPLAIAVVVLVYGFPTRDGVWAAAGLAGIVQAYAGAPFYRGTWDAVRSRVGNMDVLIAVGTTAAYGYSLWSLLRPGTVPAATYFDASALIIALILTGNYLEGLVRDRAGTALQHLEALLPATAERIEGSGSREIPIDELRPGDLVRVRAGSRFVADGRIRTGRTSVEQSLLTGELRPVPKGPSDTVLAGSLNGEGTVEVEVTGTPADSFVAQIGRLLTDAEAQRVPLRRTADRLAAIFVPVVFLLAIAAAVGWYLWGGASAPVSLLIFVTVVITACPCAFGIATPAAIMVGVGRAAGEGILYRGADALERTAQADFVLMDKTGTLTASTATRVEVLPAPGSTREEVFSLAAGLELGSDHVLARAVGKRAAESGVTPASVTDLRVDPGRGVRGKWNDRPVAVLDGDSARVEGVDLLELARAAGESDAMGASWSVVLRDGQAIGLLRFGAELAPGAAEAIAGLRDLGIPVVMVTGDRKAPAEALARQLGIDHVEAEVRPEGKVELVRRYSAAGHRVAFVGDGLNDAPALAAAHVGLAVGTGTDVAREAGQVLLVRSDLRSVPRAIRLARCTVGQVRWNLTWALGYNAVLLPVAMGALVPFLGFSVYDYLPVAGAIAMGISSTTVVANSLSLRWVSLEPKRPVLPARASLPH